MAETFDEAIDAFLAQIREHQIEVAKLPDSDPRKPVVKEFLALQIEMTQMLAAGELDVAECVQLLRDYKEPHHAAVTIAPRCRDGV
jgi:hypothetical protein